MKLTPLTKAGQLNVGDALLIEDKRGGAFIAEVKLIIESGKQSEEVVISRTKNVYFLISNYLEGKSWVKTVDVINNAQITNICNTRKKFEIY